MGLRPAVVKDLRLPLRHTRDRGTLTPLVYHDAALTTTNASGEQNLTADRFRAVTKPAHYVADYYGSR